MRNERVDSRISAVVCVLAVLIGLPAATAHAAGLVAGIKKAWVVPDGDVSGERALYVIDLAGSMDPDVPGRALAKGKQIRVIFPPEFDLANLDPAYPLLDFPVPSQPCVPTSFQCTTAVLLKGWPEEPYFLPNQWATLSIDTAANAFVFTALQDIEPSTPQSPGIKQLFLLLHGVTNPAPGDYRIRVEAQTGFWGRWETGSALLRIVPEPRPSIDATSVFVKALSGLLPSGPACGPGTLPPNPDNPVFQQTDVGSNAPYVWSFLLWGEHREPLSDVWLDWTDESHARLMRGAAAVGQVFVDAPYGASGYALEVNPLGCPTLLPAAPVIGPTAGVGPDPVGRLDIQFRTGDKPGDYVTTLALDNGNSVQMVVTACDRRGHGWDRNADRSGSRYCDRPRFEWR
jgi:hypothetical protein